jgi:hypothetical protein
VRVPFVSFVFITVFENACEQMSRSSRIFKKRKGGHGRTKKSSVNTVNNLYGNENSVNNVSSVSGCSESSFRLGVSCVSAPSANVDFVLSVPPAFIFIFQFNICVYLYVL